MVVLAEERSLLVTCLATGTSLVEVLDMFLDA